jgi:tetratricopeptide (TPR) repeat protein
LYEEGLKLSKATLGAEHRETLVSMNNLGMAYLGAGKLDMALPLLKDALELRKATLGAGDPATRNSMSVLAAAYAKAGKTDLALPLAREAAAGIELQRYEHHAAGEIVSTLVSCLEVLEQDDRAEALRRKWLALLKERFGAESAAYVSQLAGLGRNLLKQEKLDEAEAAFCEVVRLRTGDAALHWIAGVCVEAGRYAVAEAALREAARLKPESAAPHYALGTGYARLGRWDNAAAAFGRGLALDPASHERWYHAATLHLGAGDTEGYRRASREMIERFGASDDPATAERTVKACSLAPGAVAGFGGVEALAQRAVSGTENHAYYRYFVLAKGLAEYRAGRHAEAVQWLERFAPRTDGVHWDATALAALAIVRHRLGQSEQAAAALDQAKAIVGGKMPDPAQGRPFDDGNWHDWLHAQILCHEATGLLTATPDAATSASQVPEALEQLPR